MPDKNVGSPLTAWLYSKLGKVFVAYIAVIVCLVYAVEWVSEHDAAIKAVLGLFGLLAALYIAGRIYSYNRRW